MKKSEKMNRRDFLKLGATMAAGLAAVAACQPAPTATPAASQATTAPAAPTSAPAAVEAAKLTFVCDTINAGHGKVRDAWTQKFTAKFPTVTVEHQPVPTADYNTKIQTLFAAGTPPDIYRYLQEVVPIISAVTKKMHLQLDPYIAADKYDLSDFRKEAVNLYVWEGGTYALPRDYGDQNLFINLDLFKKAGIEPPTADWEDKNFTFDKFLEMAKALTLKTGRKSINGAFWSTGVGVRGLPGYITTARLWSRETPRVWLHRFRWMKPPR